MAKEKAPRGAPSSDPPAAGPPGPFATAVRSARLALQHPLFDRPAVALVLMGVLFALSECARLHFPYAYQYPTAAFGDLPAVWLLDRLHLQSIIGLGPATALALRSSLLLFLIDSLAVIAVARRWPRARDAAAVAGGTVWAVAVAGWSFAAGMLVVAAVVHFGFRRLNSHLSMALTTALLVVAFKYFIRARAYPGADFLALAANAATQGSMALGALRLIMYAFEASSVPREARSFLTVLAYSPLGLFLWPADPPMTSYLMYAAPVARPALDRQGSRQLCRSGFKYLTLVCLVRVLAFFLPPGSSFPAAPVGVRLLGFLIAPAAYYLRISLTADFAYGLSSLAGYHAADAFDAPFLAENPVNFWQTWNIPVLSFLRRAFIFPVSMRRRSLMRSIIAGMTGAAIMHCVVAWLRIGPRLTPAIALLQLRGQARFYAITAVILLIGAPFYQSQNTRKLPARIVLLVLTQCAMGWLLFGTIAEICPGVGGLPAPVKDVFAHLSSVF